MTTAVKTITRAEAEPPFFVGIDLGGTTIKLGLVDDLGRTLGFCEVPTEVAEGAEAAANRMGIQVRSLVDHALLRPGDVARIGLGSPGTMDIPAGMLLEPVNLHGWNQFPLRDRVSHHCGLPVTFSNDAAAAAYGEYWLGAGRGSQSMVMFTLGTGVGCGIIANGMSITGQHSHGGECGHSIIDFHDDARRCGCGQTGHLEAYASANAVVKRANEALESGMKTSINRRLEQGEPLTPKLIAQEAESGDTLALEIVLETARYVAVGVVNLMHTIDPDSVLIGGAMTFGGKNSPLGQNFLECIRQEVHRRAFPIPREQTTIEYAALGSDAGYLGAAGLARAAFLAARA
jgi:glucokinase